MYHMYAIGEKLNQHRLFLDFLLNTIKTGIFLMLRQWVNIKSTQIFSEHILLQTIK